MPFFPRLRLVAAAALGVYLVTYTVSYGLDDFLFLCNLSVILTAIGLWTASPLLLSSQAVAIVLVGAVWTTDFALRLLLGRHVVGGTEYMWDPQWPLVARSLSLYHVVLPPLLVWALRRVGYDRRGYLLQSGIALVLVPVGRLFGPELNMNSAFVEPLCRRTWGSPLAHVAVVIAFLVLVAYPLSHLLLVRLCSVRPAAGQQQRLESRAA